MANRHSHKKLRAEIRARMAKTGESYQAALLRILARTNEQRTAVDLIPFRFFGVPLTMAITEASDVQSISVLHRFRPTSQSYPLPLAAWLWPQGVN